MGRRGWCLTLPIHLGQGFIFVDISWYLKEVNIPKSLLTNRCFYSIFQTSGMHAALCSRQFSISRLPKTMIFIYWYCNRINISKLGNTNWLKSYKCLHTTDVYYRPDHSNTKVQVYRYTGNTSTFTIDKYECSSMARVAATWFEIRSSAQLRDRTWDGY